MQFLMIVATIAVMLAAYLSSTTVHLLPSVFKFLPELMSIVIAAAVGVRGVHQHFRFAPTRYLVTCVALLLIIVCGIIANQVAPGPILAGMRYYLRAMPFFFLPAVVDFTDSQLRNLMRVILGLSLLQLPIAFYQRYHQAVTGHNTGDAVFGSLMQSGNLSIFLICVICVMAALMIRGRMGKITFFALFLLFVLPMSINETKVTIFALPIGLITTAVLGSPRGRKIAVLGYTTLAIIAAAVVFVPLYDFFNAYNNFGPERGRIEDWLTNPDKMESYLDTHSTVGSHKEAGRVDAIKVPLQVLSEDPVRFGLGLGIGNASSSMIGPQFTGRYYGRYGTYTVETSMATFMLELGMFGTLLILLLHWMVFKDALFLMRADDRLTGAIALGWIGISIVVLACNFYITQHTSEAISCMFWFFSGLIASTRCRLELARASARHAARVAPLAHQSLAATREAT